VGASSVLYSDRRAVQAIGRTDRGADRNEGLKGTLGASKGALDAAAAAALDCFHMCPSLDLLLPALLEGGIPEMQRRCTLTPGAPANPVPIIE
jgi:hypothetical protein